MEDGTAGRQHRTTDMKLKRQNTARAMAATAPRRPASHGRLGYPREGLRERSQQGATRGLLLGLLRRLLDGILPKALDRLDIPPEQQFSTELVGGEVLPRKQDALICAAIEGRSVDSGCAWEEMVRAPASSSIEGGSKNAAVRA